MHPIVEFIHPETNGVQSVDSRAQEGEKDRFSWGERLAILGGKRRELLGREEHDATSSFKVTGEEASTRVYVGFRGASSVGPRGCTKGRRETRGCHGRSSGTRSLSEGKKVMWEGIVHLATLVFLKLRGRKIEGAERANYTTPFFIFIFFIFTFFLLTMFIAVARRAWR